MKYDQITKATFLERENRFVAKVRIGSDEIRVHVKNTGRCRELLVPDATVYLDDHRDKMGKRKYRYDLVAVEKGDILVNMDSQAPNKVVAEALRSGELILPEVADARAPRKIDARAPRKIGARAPLPAEKPAPQPAGDSILVHPEKSFGSSRFDFYVEHRIPSSPPFRAFLEVKGVTLEENGIARFPDAPTERGVKHLKELEQALTDGYAAYIIFVVQMKGMKWFEPNDETHPEFGEALRHAKATGVRVSAYDCIVTENTLKLDSPVQIRL